MLRTIRIRVIVDIAATHAEHQSASATIGTTYTTPGGNFNNASLSHLSNNDLLPVGKIDDKWGIRDWKWKF